MKLKPFTAPLALLLLSLFAPAFASPITYPGSPATDTAGVAVTSGVTVTVASLSDLDGNTKTSTLAVAHVAGGNTSAVYDAAVNGEAWVTLTLTATGHTFAPSTIFCSSDPSTLLATPAATVAALYAQTFITIPGSGTTTSIGESLTWKQFESLADSLAGGNLTATAPVASGTATVTYYLLGQPKVSGNVVAISTPTYDANKALTGRVTLIAQPFPTF